MVVHKDPIYLRTSKLQNHKHFPKKKTYQLGWRTNRILSDQPSLTTTKNGHARGPTALSPAPNCGYYAMLFTKVQTYHELPRGMQRIRGPLILEIT